MIFQLKSPTVYEAEEEAFEQVRIYNNALPELFKYLQFYAVSEGIRLFYGQLGNMNQRFYRWKVENGFFHLIGSFGKLCVMMKT